jgi:hypothetical protein
MRALAIAALVACGSDPITPPEPGEITLVVTSPAPGEELLASEHPTITVTGTISSTSPDALEVWVNRSRVEVAADGSFTAELPPTLGVNHVDVEGGDGVGAYVTQELDVLWAPAYLPPIAGTTGFALPGALELRLGQRFFDPRVFDTTLDLTTDPVVARDLASALELIIWHLDLASLLDGAIQVGEGNATLDVTIPSATPANIVVDARIVEGNRIALDIDLLGVFLATDGTFRFGNRTLLVDGGIAADMHASATLELTLANDAIEVTVLDATATVGPLVPQFDGPNGDELDAFITIGGNDFRTLVEGLIVADLVPAFTEQVPPLLEALLGATGNLLDNVSFPLDPGLGNPVTLMLDGTTGGLDVMPGPTLGHVTVRQDVTIQTSAVAPIHPSSRGAPQTAAMPEQSFSGASSVGVNLRQDFLNALLHALWNSGLLEGSATFGGLTATLSARLPPVVLPTPPESSCKIDGVRCDVIIQLGQIEIQLADFEQSFAVNATAGARILVDGNQISLVIEETPVLRAWETSTGGGQLTPDAIEEVIGDVVWPELFGAIGENLSLTLPIPDLAELGLTELAPGLANAQLKLVMRDRPSVATGFLGLGADLELATPPP